MLSKQELSDRFEIQDLVFHYADLVDSKQIGCLRDEVFTDDVHVDYSATGGSVGDLDTTLEFLESVLTNELFPNTQHLNANVQVNLHGDTATGRVMCFNSMEIRLPDGGTHTYFLGMWYVDEYRRTDKGWRISRRAGENSWVFNAPNFTKDL